MKDTLTEFCTFLENEGIVIEQNVIDRFIEEIKVKNADELEVIKTIVCKHTHIKINDIGIKTRKREIVEARQLAMWMMRNYTKKSYSDIASSFGDFDHATVCHSIRTVNNLVDSNKKYRDLFIGIMDEVGICFKKFLVTDRLTRIENEIASKLIESQKDIDPEIAQIVSDHYWEIL